MVPTVFIVVDCGNVIDSVQVGQSDVQVVVLDFDSIDLDPDEARKILREYGEELESTDALRDRLQGIVDEADEEEAAVEDECDEEDDEVFDSRLLDDDFDADPADDFGDDEEFDDEEVEEGDDGYTIGDILDEAASAATNEDENPHRRDYAGRVTPLPVPPNVAINAEPEDDDKKESDYAGDDFHVPVPDFGVPAHISERRSWRIGDYNANALVPVAPSGALDHRD
jgi:hypothetical protein